MFLTCKITEPSVRPFSKGISLKNKLFLTYDDPYLWPNLVSVPFPKEFPFKITWFQPVSEVKWSTFGPLIFFILRYVKGGVLGNNYISIKKCTTTFLWVLNFGQVGEILENF